MLKLYKPERETLDKVRAEAIMGEKESLWQMRYLANVAKLLNDDPKLYLSYGPYWWLLKKELTAHGFRGFGDAIDREWFENTDYGNSTDNILAAHVYNEYAMEYGLCYSNDHQYSYFDEDGHPELAIYTLIDSDMETYSAGKKAVDKR